MLKNMETIQILSSLLVGKVIFISAALYRLHVQSREIHWDQI